MEKLREFLEKLEQNKKEIDLRNITCVGLQRENYIRTVLSGAHTIYIQAFNHVIESDDDTVKLEFLKWMAQNRWLMRFRWVLFSDSGRTQEKYIIDTISSDENKRKGYEIAGIKDSDRELNDSENPVNTVQTDEKDPYTR